MNKRQINLFGEPQIKNFIPPALPYMGNKRKLATKILNSIYQKIGDFENFYDLFGGGGSMSMAALIAGHNVVYNELNTGVYNLMKHLQSGGEIPYEWVSREEFFANKDGDDWYSGLIKTVWSFGNKQSSYLFGEDIEEQKRLAHEMIINKDESARKELEKLLNIGLIGIKTRQQFSQLVKKKLKSRTGELQHLEQLQRLELKNKSYSKIEIKENSVIYCDPPYAGTGEYQRGGFNHDKFYEWCLAQKKPVFISEYNMPDSFECIAEFKHRSTLSSTANNEVTEKLYWNGVF